MIASMQKKLIALMVLFALMISYNVQTSMISYQKVQFAGLLPVAISSLCAVAQILSKQGNPLVSFGIGAVVGSAFYFPLREYTSSQIIYRGQELIKTLKLTQISHILTYDNGSKDANDKYIEEKEEKFDFITPDRINRIPGRSFTIAQDECNKFVPIVKQHCLWIEQTEALESSGILAELRKYETRMGVICSVIKKNASIDTDQADKCTTEMRNKLQLQKLENDLGNEKKIAQSIETDANTRFYTAILPWGKFIAGIFLLGPVCYIFFKLTFAIARFV